MSVFSFFKTLIEDIFSAVKRAWNHLPPAVQQQIINGSGVFSILSQYIGQDAKLTIATIQANYPGLNLDQLYTGLSAVAKTWGITIPPDLESLVVAIQGHLQGLEDSEWDRILSGGAQILADVFSGAGTPFEVIVTVIQWVYTNIVKPKPVTVVLLPPPIS